MPQYRYEIRTQNGQVSAGLISATTLASASDQLRSQGVYILQLAPAESFAATGLQKVLSLNLQSGPSQKDVLNFTNQLAVMVKAGINIRQAIEGIADQLDNQKFKAIINHVKKDVESGKPFSDALAKYPKVFSPMYVNMVRASELSGSFGGMLERIAGYLAEQIETRSMVRGAMLYPSIIGFMAVATTVFLLTYVLPRFVIIFQGKEAALPAPTKIILAMSDFMVNFWYLVLAGVGAGIWAFLLLIRTPWGRLWWDKLKLTAPIFRKLCRCLYISRSLHTMGQLVNAGVPMLDTISITGSISGNALFQRMWRSVYNSVKQGKRIAQPLHRSPLLPSSVVQMISSGEQSGKLGEVLDDVAAYYAKELRNIIKAVTAMIEPLMIVMMGVIVGFIAMSIILPIFKLSSLVH